MLKHKRQATRSCKSQTGWSWIRYISRWHHLCFAEHPSSLLYFFVYCHQNERIHYYSYSGDYHRHLTPTVTQTYLAKHHIKQSTNISNIHYDKRFALRGQKTARPEEPRWRCDSWGWTASQLWVLEYCKLPSRVRGRAVAQIHFLYNFWPTDDNWRLRFSPVTD